MSAPARLGLAQRHLEVLPVDVVVVSCFADERPLRGLASRADWRCGGALSKLLQEGSFTGEVGETAMVVGARGLVAPRVLLTGQGRRAALDADRLREWGIEALARCLALSVKRVALALLPAAHQPIHEQAAALLAAVSHAPRGLPGWPETGIEVWLAALEAERAATAAALHELAPRLPADVRLLADGPGPTTGSVESPRRPAVPRTAHQGPSTPYR